MAKGSNTTRTSGAATTRSSQTNGGGIPTWNDGINRGWEDTNPYHAPAMGQHEMLGTAYKLPRSQRLSIREDERSQIWGLTHDELRKREADNEREMEMWNRILNEQTTSEMRKDYRKLDRLTDAHRRVEEYKFRRDIDRFSLKTGKK